ncbi:MAG: hypothetical protein RL701_3819 [Pseudomonadota bacterium]|jgi:hypothetical protein
MTLRGTNTSPLRWLPLAACGVLALTLLGCLEPNTDGEPYSSYVLPANTLIPRLDDDAAAATKLDMNDGLEKMISLRTAFVDGNAVYYWDFGPLTATTLRPMYIFRSRSDDSSDLSRREGHPDLIDAIPGDAAYSPLRQLYVVYFNARWKGERITSLRALEDAVELGLVQSPQPYPPSRAPMPGTPVITYFMNCVVTTAKTLMQASPDGAWAVAQDVYYRGKLVKQFCAGSLLPDQVLTIGEGSIELKDNTFTPGNGYMLRRENENQPLDEVLLKKDLNGDKDTFDTNIVFNAMVVDPAAPPPAMAPVPAYSGIWRNFDVVVHRDYMFGSVTTESELFDRMGSLLNSKPTVVEYRDTGTFLNRPLRKMN